MLVTFTTNAYSDITMFGAAAEALLKLMGQSGNVPGAIMAEEVPQALEKLKTGLSKIPEQSAEQTPPVENNEDEEKEVPIGLDKRAGPLITLLEAAIASKANVLWNN